MFGRAGELLYYLQGAEGEWREDEEDTTENFEDDEDTLFNGLVENEPIVPHRIQVSAVRGECSICITDIEENDKHTLKCGHEFCMGCLAAYLLHQIKSREVEQCQVRRERFCHVLHRCLSFCLRTRLWCPGNQLGAVVAHRLNSSSAISGVSVAHPSVARPSWKNQR